MVDVEVTERPAGASESPERRHVPHHDRRIPRYVEPALAVAVVLGCWEAVTRLHWLPRDAFPPLTVVVPALLHDLSNSALWNGIAVTMETWAIGLAIVVVIGIPLGLLLGTSRIAYDIAHLTVEFFRTVPSIAALSILVLLFGVTSKLVVVMVVFTAVWPLLVQSMYGAHDVDPMATEMARVYGLGWRARFRRVVVPSALPYIASGLRLSGTMALLLAISVTLIVGGQGLGALLSSAAQSGQIALLYARVVVSAALGLLVTYGLLSLERRLLRWHPSRRVVV